MLETLPLFAHTQLTEVTLWGLIIASFFTSAFTAAFGIGGGVTLLAILGMVIPVTTLIPVHGTVQMGSNAGRAWHLRNHIHWRLIGLIALGAIVGTLLGSQIVIALPDALLKIILALFVLAITWLPTPRRVKSGDRTVGVGAFIASLAGMFVGATGPLLAALISGRIANRQGVVATHAAAMTLSHALKIIAFGFIGFAYTNWLGLIGAMILSGYLGTRTGSKLLHVMDEALFRKIFRVIITALALLMLLGAARSVL
nr:sulfite exporter TauE/SafE family protein [uncultured Cohaesibacter sp.]